MVLLTHICCLRSVAHGQDEIKSVTDSDDLHTVCPCLAHFCWMNLSLGTFDGLALLCSSACPLLFSFPPWVAPIEASVSPHFHLSKGAAAV